MRPWITLLPLLLCLLALGCVPEMPIGDDDDAADDDDVSDDDVADDDVADDDDTLPDDDDDVADDDDTGDDDTGDDDTGQPVDADGDGWDETVDCDDTDAELNLDDADADGYDTCSGDCNDGNGAINPLATDVLGDGIDQNCDGMDGVDADGDGYAADFSFGDDCDDSDASIHPGATDVCDGVDSDCDGDLSWEEDADGDGFLNCDGDCDDVDPAVNPDAAEVECNYLDDDCDGALHPYEVDDDGDGYDECNDDCNDGDAALNPGAHETCLDGMDNDCDGLLDETCVTDAFTQTGNHATDILWVVDNSCSMYEEQGQLDSNAEAFFDVLDLLGVDYRVAVVTTDTGEFQGLPSVVAPSLSDPADDFADNCDVGTGGSATEQGLMYAEEGMDLAAAGTSPNEDFYREEAGLHVIIVSDEDDQSPGPTNDWVLALQAYHVNPDHLTISGITGQLTGCSGLTGNAYSAAEYELAISVTGGISESICSSSYATVLENLGYMSDHHADTFMLSAVPDEVTIEVVVEGVNVATGWSFDATLNAVVFDAASVPDNGDVVEISYAQ